MFDLIVYIIVQSAAVLTWYQTIKFIVHIVISVLPGTPLHLSQVKHVRVKRNQTGFEIAWQAATMAKRHTRHCATSSTYSITYTQYIIMEHDIRLIKVIKV